TSRWSRSFSCRRARQGIGIGVVHCLEHRAFEALLLGLEQDDRIGRQILHRELKRGGGRREATVQQTAFRSVVIPDVELGRHVIAESCHSVLTWRRSAHFIIHVWRGNPSDSLRSLPALSSAGSAAAAEADGDPTLGCRSGQDKAPLRHWTGAARGQVEPEIRSEIRLRERTEDMGMEAPLYKRAAFSPSFQHEQAEPQKTCWSAPCSGAHCDRQRLERRQPVPKNDAMALSKPPTLFGTWQKAVRLMFTPDRPPSPEPLRAALTDADDSLRLEHWLAPQPGIVPRLRIGRRWVNTLWALPIGAAGLLCLIALAQSLRELPAVIAFIQQHPGIAQAAPSVDSGFPWWLQLQHFLNMFFMLFIMRAGLQILADHPRLYWGRDC